MLEREEQHLVDCFFFAAFCSIPAIYSSISSLDHWMQFQQAHEADCESPTQLERAIRISIHPKFDLTNDLCAK